MRHFILVLTTVCVTWNALAIPKYNNGNVVHSNKLNSYTLTKSEENDYEPEQFQSSNNLLRAPGNIAQYCGNKVIIKGVVLNQHGIPISDAKVYLWQVGCDGKYPYKPLRTRIDKQMLNLATNSTFQGSGISTTNNMGEFYFITILPPTLDGNNKPYVNIRVGLTDFGDVQTKLYFSNEKLSNEKGRGLLANISEDTPVYNFEIIVPWDSLKSY